MDYPVLNKAPNVADAMVPGYLDANGNFIPASYANPLPTTSVDAAGGNITWSAPVAVTMTGASITLIAANPLRKGIIIQNPVGNAQVSYDPSGATVTLAAGVALLGGDRDVYTGGDCDQGIYTAIGTNTQTVIVIEGL